MRKRAPEPAPTSKLNLMILPETILNLAHVQSITKSTAFDADNVQHEDGCDIEMLGGSILHTEMPFEIIADHLEHVTEEQA